MLNVFIKGAKAKEGRRTKREERERVRRRRKRLNFNPHTQEKSRS